MAMIFDCSRWNRAKIDSDLIIISNPFLSNTRSIISKLVFAYFTRLNRWQPEQCVSKLVQTSIAKFGNVGCYSLGLDEIFSLSMRPMRRSLLSNKGPLYFYKTWQNYILVFMFFFSKSRCFQGYRWGMIRCIADPLDFWYMRQD